MTGAETSENFWRLHNKELGDLYMSSTVVKTIKSRWIQRAGYVVGMGGNKEWIQNFDLKLLIKCPLRRIYKDNINMDVKKIRCEDAEWMGLTKESLKWRRIL